MFGYDEVWSLNVEAVGAIQCGYFDLYDIPVFCIILLFGRMLYILSLII